jgi:hypothetical protein
MYSHNDPKGVDLVLRSKANESVLAGMIISSILTAIVAVFICIGFVFDVYQKYETIIQNMAGFQNDEIQRHENRINELRYEIEQLTNSLNDCERNEPTNCQ